MNTSDLSGVTAENLSEDDDNYDDNYVSCITRIGDETTRYVLNFSFDLNTKRVFNATIILYTYLDILTLSYISIKYENTFFKIRLIP